MGRQDYRSYQQPVNKDEVIETVIVDGEVKVDLSMVEQEEVFENVELPKEENRVAEPELIGKVYNCSKLNVRENPTKRANILEVLELSDEFSTWVTQSSNGWIKVKTKNGTVGYCMRDFIKIK